MQRALLLALVLSLTACGFTLRGDYRLPFRSVWVDADPGQPFAAELARALTNLGNIRLSESRAWADVSTRPEVRLRLIESLVDKRIVSLSSGGKVREFALEHRVRFELLDRNDIAVVPVESITVLREFSFNDSQALAKEAEERQLLVDMQSDAVAQLLRRLQAVNLSPTTRTN